MNGYLLTFYTQQDRSIHGQPIGQWLVEQAKAVGIHGATLVAASEGFGHDKKLHSVHFFELTDQPIEVSMAISGIDAMKIFTALKHNQVNVFYTMMPIEYGMSADFTEDPSI